MYNLPSLVNVYTDGACSSNGAPSAVAGIGVHIEEAPDSNISERVGSEYPQTNQVAELLAILRALEICDQSSDIAIYSDSQYAVGCINVWYKQWMQNDWKKRNGETPANIDIIKEIVGKIAKMKLLNKTVNVMKVQAHSTNIGNNIADKLAKDALKMAIEEDLNNVIGIIREVEDISSSLENRQSDTLSIAPLSLQPNKLTTSTSVNSDKVDIDSIVSRMENNLVEVRSTANEIYGMMNDMYHIVESIQSDYDKLVAIKAAVNEGK